MAKVRTNFFELLLKEIMIGKEMYDDNGVKFIIDDINYQPVLQEVYVKSGDNGYKLSINTNYDFELDLSDIKRIKPNKGRLRGKNKL